MTTMTAEPKKDLSPARKFRQGTTAIATSLLRDWVGEEKAKEAAGRISLALSAAAASARNPADFYACTPESIGRCVAIAALSEIMPGTGATALAYLIPRRARKGEQPQLQYQLSHRGLNALARRTGQTMFAVPIGHNDELTFSEDGDPQIVERDIDNPPENEEQLRGILVLIRETSTGKTISKGWVPTSIINARREISDSYQFALKQDWAKKSDPWHQWYVEMAIKTAMHYAISRGWCVIDDSAAARAIAIDQQQAASMVQRPDPAQRIDDRSETEKLNDFLGDDHPDHADAGEESQEAFEAVGEESQELPETDEAEYESQVLSQAAGPFVMRIGNATTQKAIGEILADAKQMKVASRLTEDEFDEISKEADAAKAALKKK